MFLYQKVVVVECCAVLMLAYGMRTRIAVPENNIHCKRVFGR